MPRPLRDLSDVSVRCDEDGNEAVPQVLGAIGTGLAYVLNYRIITDDGPLLASTYLLSVVAVLLDARILHEPMTIQLGLGVLVVLGGVATTPPRQATKRQPRKANQPRYGD